MILYDSSLLSRFCKKKKHSNESIPLPRFGILNVFNSHLLAECDSGEKCILIGFDWIFLLFRKKNCISDVYSMQDHDFFVLNI